MPEINQAAEVLEQDRPTEELETTATAVADEAGEANAQEGDDEKGGKRLGGWQRKIKKLEQQNETLMELLRKGGDTASPQQTAPQEDKPPAKPTRPKQEHFNDWDKYQAALDKYEDDRDKYHEENLAYQLRKAEAQRQQKSEQQSVADSFATQVAEAKQQYADFDQVAFNPDVPMSAPMMDAIVTSEFAAHIAYELGKNPDEAERISKLQPIVAVREIGKIEARIAAKTSAADEKEEKEPQAAPTRAPRPPSPVRRPAAVSNDPEDSDDYKTWLRKREAQLRK